MTRDMLIFTFIYLIVCFLCQILHIPHSLHVASQSPIGRCAYASMCMQSRAFIRVLSSWTPLQYVGRLFLGIAFPRYSICQAVPFCFSRHHVTTSCPQHSLLPKAGRGHWHRKRHTEPLFRAISASLSLGSLPLLKVPVQNIYVHTYLRHMVCVATPTPLLLPNLFETTVKVNLSISCSENDVDIFRMLRNSWPNLRWCQLGLEDMNEVLFNCRACWHRQTTRAWMSWFHLTCRCQFEPVWLQSSQCG